MIGENIRFLRKRKGYSQGQLALKLNIKQASLSLWESNKTRPDVDHLAEMAAIFEVPVDFFFSNESRRELDNISIKRAAVPIVGEIACGLPLTAEQNITGYADLPDGVNADFALKCKGDSMSPTFEDGDLVLIRKQEDVENGQIAAVCIQNDTTLKHVYHQERGLMLIADNPRYQPIFVPTDTDDEIIIHGLAVGYVRLFREQEAY